MLKKVCVALCFFFLFSRVNLFSQEKPFYDYSLEANFSLQTGVVDELVYENEVLLSKLAWQHIITPMVNLTYNARFNSTFLKLQFQTAIPEKTGTMEDFDYLTPVDGIVSKYSKHDMDVAKSYFFKVQLSYDFKITDIYKLQPLLGATYQNQKFTAVDGYFQYSVGNGVWTPSLEKVALTGSIISYEQTILYPFIGIDNIFLTDSFFFTIHASYFPYVYVQSLDNHYLTGKQYYDDMRAGYGFLTGASFYIPFRKEDDYGLKIGLEYEFFEAYGLSASNTIGSKNNDFSLSHGVTSGTQSGLFRFSVGFVLRPNYWK